MPPSSICTTSTLTGDSDWARYVWIASYVWERVGRNSIMLLMGRLLPRNTSSTVTSENPSLSSEYLIRKNGETGGGKVFGLHIDLGHHFHRLKKERYASVKRPIHMVVL